MPKQIFINGKIFVGDTEDHFINSMVVEDGTVKLVIIYLMKAKLLICKDKQFCQD